jgi:hypothetical protein
LIGLHAFSASKAVEPIAAAIVILGRPRHPALSVKVVIRATSVLKFKVE